MGKIFCFIGKSSSGKDTIFKIILNDLSNLKIITPYTTRPIRNGEVNGREYYFVSDEVFKQMKNDNLVVESRSYNTVHGIWTYFTSSSEIDLDNNDYAVINTLEGYNNFKRYFDNDILVPIYIELEDGLRLERALKREMKEPVPKYEEMCRRFLADQNDFSEDKLLESGISKRFINNDLAECVLEIEQEINSYLNKEKQLRK